MPVASIPNLNWGSIADWVSGIGSLAAATVALYVALSSQRVKLRGYCGLRLIIGGQEPKFEVFSVSVTNISQRPTVITNVGFTFGLFRWKRHGLEYALTLVRRRLQASNQIVDRLPVRRIRCGTRSRP